MQIDDDVYDEHDNEHGIQDEHSEHGERSEVDENGEHVGEHGGHIEDGNHGEQGLDDCVWEEREGQASFSSSPALTGHHLP